MLIWPGSVSQLEVCTSKVRRGNVSPLEIDTIRYDDKLSMFQLSRSNSQRITSKAGWYLLSIISSSPPPIGKQERHSSNEPSSGCWLVSLAWLKPVVTPINWEASRTAQVRQPGQRTCRSSSDHVLCHDRRRMWRSIVFTEISITTHRQN